jgi:hypothetical protein
MTSTRSALVIAGRSADSPALASALRLYAAAAPARFTLLVPAVPHGLAWATDMSAGWPQAAARAERASARLRARGLELEETIVGDPDPVAAVGDVLHCRRFDELIVVTLPRGASSWLRLGLPGRLRRVTELPITRITVDRTLRVRPREAERGMAAISR